MLISHAIQVDLTEWASIPVDRKIYSQNPAASVNLREKIALRGQLGRDRVDSCCLNEIEPGDKPQ
ncbi:hypothetical protein AV650_02720 [Serratia fonticola]|nr:hypothetical protein AV650_02720 [Serratia fonticola]PAA96717.1 hypothetical protein CJJ13_15465 [Serratia fonticola]